MNNDKTALLSYMDDYAVFSLNLEDNFEDEQLYKIVKSLSEEQKEILTLSILEEWSSKEIARKFNKSDSRIRHIIRDTIAKIKKDYEENQYMENLYYEILLAKDGDAIANENIIKNYNKYITFMINRYEIIDKKNCYDEVKRNILKAIQKIKI